MRYAVAEELREVRSPEKEVVVPREEFLVQESVVPYNRCMAATIESRGTETGFILRAVPRSTLMSVNTCLWNIGGTATMTTSFSTAMGNTESSRAVRLEMSLSTEGSIVRVFRSIIEVRWNVNCR